MPKLVKKPLVRDPSLTIRLSEADDARVVTDSIIAGGAGLGYYKAIFGQTVNVPAVIDLSLLSLYGETLTPLEDDYKSEFRGFLCLDDSISLMTNSNNPANDSQMFEPVINILQNCLGVTVSTMRPAILPFLHYISLFWLFSLFSFFFYGFLSVRRIILYL
jgi:hypothetical protein